LHIVWHGFPLVVIRIAVCTDYRIMKRFSLVLLGTLLVGPAAHGDPDYGPAVRINTREGPVAGSLGLSGAVRIFLGIPYAEPPTGPRRWRAPQPKQPWTG